MTVVMGFTNVMGPLVLYRNIKKIGFDFYLILFAEMTTVVRFSEGYPISWG